MSLEVAETYQPQLILLSLIAPCRDPSVDNDLVFGIRESRFVVTCQRLKVYLCLHYPKEAGPTLLTAMRFMNTAMCYEEAQQFVCVNLPRLLAAGLCRRERAL